ncbi:hypothetical protein [Methylomonas sp. HYX-M1]|uniref:hypothetical protein n=1 Tax=Methylomonas sp. HYX-M1 TaxID=3139307 RepID=UPI00345C0060
MNQASFFNMKSKPEGSELSGKRPQVSRQGCNELWFILVRTLVQIDCFGAYSEKINRLYVASLTKRE